MPSTVRIGLIGCDGIARRHIRWLPEWVECKIHALCDVSPESEHGPVIIA